ncbi:hypothetical protein CTAYLR_008563 [Chrysophaeum taylorii]|uniref:BD-FAE-like domain-containing protein n=1 Tax=Chrysophaeum taylorii TaxID=2483200 RepID=A0AAD7U6K5_9STRA|nr:hypothetical protein CTAYLR_008563 [Chrysophaeum taylorii]
MCRRPQVAIPGKSKSLGGGLGDLGRQCVTVGKLGTKLCWLVMQGSPLWIVMVIKLILFALALAPALASSVHYWCGRVRKNVAYGPGLRHLLDVYEPGGKHLENKPVVVFVTGGAWIIGYKAWAVPLGRALSANGVVVFAPDYRNCPQARIDGMLDDVDRAVGWTFRNARAFGADPRKILLAGQSAGAHLVSLLLLRKAESEYFGGSPTYGWRASDVLGFVGVSGPYHLEATAVQWMARGLNRNIFAWVFGNDLHRHSPADECSRIRELVDDKFATTLLPRICLIHGTADLSAPYVTSELLEARLRLLGADVLPTITYRDWTHTDPILEKPFAGDHAVHADIFDLIYTWQNTTERPAFDITSPDCRRLAPQFLLDIGRACMPF